MKEGVSEGKKILVATGIYPPDIGGPATYTKMLEDHLSSHGFRLVIAPYGWVRRYPKIFRHIAYAWKLIRESKSCDLIYALDPVSVGLPALIAHKVTKKPLLLRIAGDYAWEQGQQRFGVTDLLDVFVKRIRRYHPFVEILMWIERVVARAALRIVVPSEYMKNMVSAWGIPQEKITRIYSALHPLMVNESREELRAMFNYSGFVITTAGRLVPWKGISKLISILPSLQEVVGEVTLVVIGDGPLMKRLQQEAKALGIENSVRFVGSMPKQTLGAAIKASDVFVLNTAYEGMSHQLIEVMDLGVPVVTTAVGGNLELIHAEEDGLLVAYDDGEALRKAIMRIGSDPTLRDSLVRKAKSRVTDFTREKVVGELATLIKSL